MEVGHRQPVTSCFAREGSIIITSTTTNLQKALLHRQHVQPTRVTMTDLPRFPLLDKQRVPHLPPAGY